MIKRIGVMLAAVFLLLLLHIASLYGNWFGNHLEAGEVTPPPSPAATANRKQQQNLQNTGVNQQILFGDMHVHTSFSKDAFIMSLPLLGGGGAHPPADACDFARYCAGLDFWGISDHAEGLTPRHWAETKRSIQQCNAVAGNPNNPDLVAFLGWEWSQTGKNPDQHYGHKNVFFRDIDDDLVPRRPIGSGSEGLSSTLLTALNAGLSLIDFPNRQAYYDHQQFIAEYSSTPPCPQQVPTKELPVNCEETAPTPAELNQKLDSWGFDSLIIPHGNAWGITSPMGADFATQLNRHTFNPDRERLIEVFSGHGNSEQYRPWREVSYDENGGKLCPEKSPHYLPGCRRAGEIIFDRCMHAGLGHTLCEQRQQQAQQHYIDAGLLKGFMTVPGASYDDWGLSDQCEDCFLPAYNYIPRSTVQYALALSNFDDTSFNDENTDNSLEKPLRFRFGMIASSDNHAAKAGSGYKEFDRNLMSESRTPKSALLAPLIKTRRGDTSLESLAPDQLPASLALDRERYAAFTLTGGLVAVHSDSRQRQDIWKALKNKQVYATSGPQILLWFDATTLEKNHPMGSELTLDKSPIFKVKAAGSFRQNPGCPDYSVSALGENRIQSLCQGECFNPSDQRHRISRIEVIRIRPQRYPNEPLEQLIEDPWRRFDCPAMGDGCEIEFNDPEFRTTQRDSVYYVRAIQEPTTMINGQPLQCEQKNIQGQCIKFSQCDVNDAQDNCLAENEERAWSSPIFIDFLKQHQI